MPTFSTPHPITAKVDLNGDIHVHATADGQTIVDIAPLNPDQEKDRLAAEQTQVTYADGELVVVGPRPRVTRKTGAVLANICLPNGSALDACTSLGRIATQGTLGALTARTTAGDVRVAHATDAELKTGFGAVAAERIDGDLRCSTGSGAITIATVEGDATIKNSNGDTDLGTTGAQLRVKAANGDIRVEHAHTSAVLTTANGNVRVGCVDSGQVRAKTAMGAIHVGVPDGTAALLDLHTGFGAVRSDLEATAAPSPQERTVEVHAQTSAGDITISRAVATDR